MYNAQKKKQIEKLLGAKLKQNQALVAELEELTRPIAPDVAIGRISRMDAINNKSVNEAALRQARERMYALRHAMDNLNKPTFGSCGRCGNQIPFGRLLVMPETPTCIRCS